MDPSTTSWNAAIRLIVEHDTAQPRAHTEDTVRKFKDLLLSHPDLLLHSDHHGDTLLHFAARAKNLPCCRLLLSMRPSPTVQGNDMLDASNRFQRTPIHECIDDLDLVKLFMENGADANSFKHGTWSLLMTCAQKGYTEAMRYLLTNGAIPSLRNKNGFTALHLACQSQHLDCLHLLLSTAPDIAGISSNNGRLPVHIACLHGWTEGVICLIETHTRRLNEQLHQIRDTRDQSGMTILLFAICSGKLNLVQHLIETLFASDTSHSTTDLLENQVDNCGRGPLHYSVMADDIIMTKYLLDLGMNVNQADTYQHWTPLFYAKSDAVRNLLQEYGAKTQAKDRNGKRVDEVWKGGLQNVSSVTHLHSEE